MEEFDLGRFITDVPPYVKKDLAESDVLKLSRFGEISIEQYCKKCGKQRVFVYEDGFGVFENLDGRHFRRGLTSQYIENRNYIQRVPTESSDELYFSISLYCSMCKERHEFFITSDRRQIYKVGQNPSFGELQGYEINKYKDLIPKYFLEFKSSLNSYSQGKGIASFVYLRRILEHLIEENYNALPSKSSDKMKFVDKMKEVQKVHKVIPDELEDVKEHLYSVLSKGIHEYDEQECLEMYDCVKFVIEEILDKQLEEKVRQNKVREVKQKLIKKVQDKKNYVQGV